MPVYILSYRASDKFAKHLSCLQLLEARILFVPDSDVMKQGLQVILKLSAQPHGCLLALSSGQVR